MLKIVYHPRAHAHTYRGQAAINRFVIAVKWLKFLQKCFTIDTPYGGPILEHILSTDNKFTRLEIIRLLLLLMVIRCFEIRLRYR